MVGQESEAKATIVMKGAARWDGDTLVGQWAEGLGCVAYSLVQTKH